MAISNVKIEWNALPYINKIKASLNEVIKDGAERTAEDAKRILERKAPYSTGTLASEIEVKASQFKDGGWIVGAQGHGNYSKYYASFVELGTHKTQPLPYLRPALKRNRFRMAANLRNKIGIKSSNFI